MSRAGRVALVAGLILGAAVAVGVLPTPDLGKALSDASDSLGAWTYLVVPVLAFLETAAFVGLIIPGETAVLIGGVVAERGDVKLVPLIGLVWVAAVTGDVASYLLGRRLGRPFLMAHGTRLHLRARHVDRVEGFFEHSGGKAILIGRFVGVLRALTPFVAGTSGFPLRRFVRYSAVASLAWTATLTLVGYSFSGSIASAGQVVTRLTLAVAALAVGVLWARRARSDRRFHATKLTRSV